MDKVFIIFICVLIFGLFYLNYQLYNAQYKYNRYLWDSDYINEGSEESEPKFIIYNILSSCIRTTKLSSIALPKQLNIEKLTVITLNDHNVGYITKTPTDIIISLVGTTSLYDIVVSIQTDSLHTIDGIFHRGYYQYVSEFLPQVLSQCNTESERTLTFTGHSLGGACASILAYLVCINYPHKKYRVITYGSPKHMKLYSDCSIEFLHYLNQSDPVIQKPIDVPYSRTGECIHFNTDTGNDNINHSLKVYNPQTRHKISKRYHRIDELIVRFLLDLLG